MVHIHWELPALLTSIASSHGKVYSVRVRVNTDHVLGLLLERGQFDVAREYASVAKSPVSEVTLKEVCLYELVMRIKWPGESIYAVKKSSVLSK